MNDGDDDGPQKPQESSAEMVWRMMAERGGTSRCVRRLASGDPRRRGEAAGRMTADEIHALQKQIVATFIGLTRICARRRCRRKRRCLEEGAPCLDRHAGEAAERLHAFLWRERK